MMRILIIGLLAALPGQMLAGASNDAPFLQTATTTKRTGPAPLPDELPGTVGMPGAAPGGSQEYLQQMLRRRLERQERLKSTVPQTIEQEAPQQAPGRPPAVQPQPPRSTQPAPTMHQSTSPDSNEKRFEFSFSQTSIDTVINQIMKELGYSYVIDPKVTGTVSIFTQKGIPRSQLFGVLEQILKMNGQGIYKQGEMYLIAPLSDGAQIPHGIQIRPPAQPKREEAPAGQPTGSDDTGGAGTDGNQTPPGSSARQLQRTPEASALDSQEGVITYIIPLHYIASEHAKQLAQVFVSQGANVVDFAPANILIVTDHRKNIQYFLDLVNALDTDYFELNSVELIPVKSNLAKDVAEDLAKIFAPNDKSSVRIIAVERLNSILVVTHAPSVLQRVKDWIDKLDSPSASTNIKTFVYQVENNTAMGIAEVLAQLYAEGTGLPSSATGGDTDSQQTASGQAGFVGGSANNYRSSMRGGYGGSYGGYGGSYGGYGGSYGGYGGGGYGRRGVGPDISGRPMSMGGGVRAIVAGNVRIIVNEFNNSLIVQATQADYDFILDTIKQLDVLPRQVLIEAKLYRVQLTDDLSFGVAAFLEQRGATGPATTASFSGNNDVSGGNFVASTRFLVGLDRQIEVGISALRSKTHVELMEAPRLMAMDGMQATFNVGTEVPVTTSSYSDPIQSGTNTGYLSSIQYRPTGTTLLVLPRISASGVVTMDLAIEFSSATTSNTTTPSIATNSVETSLIVRDGQTIAIAGLISDHFQVNRNRVPILGDIPILGAAFGHTMRTKDKHELIFLITPRVVPNLPTAAELTLEFKRSLRHLYKYIQERESDEEQLRRKRRDKEFREIQKLQEEREKEAPKPESEQPEVSPENK